MMLSTAESTVISAAEAGLALSKAVVANAAASAGQREEQGTPWNRQTA
jgi:hypothetical protein